MAAKEFETIVNPPQEVFEQIVEWTGKTEDWAFQLDDYKFWRTNFNDFWLFTVVEKGTSNLVASVSLARWDSATDGPLYSIGMFYCKNEYREQGFGKPLFQKAMDIVGKDNATLTGVVKMADKYAKHFGFDKVPPFWHLFSKINTEDLQIPNDLSKDYIAKNVSDVDINEFHAYDRTICTRDRSKIMTSWIHLPDTFTKILFESSTNRIVGYATIRIVSMNKLSVAPFYADNLAAAEVLFAEVLHSIPKRESYASVGFLYPEINTDALKLLERFASQNDKVSSSKFIKSQFTQKFIDSPHEKVYSMSDCAHQFV